ncbi:MAG TPA: DNRLRE domain-containing protein [Tepidisphaeraceae bacterium]|jgi:hypothetical protein
MSVSHGVTVGDHNTTSQLVTQLNSTHLNADAVRYWSSTTFGSSDHLSADERSDLEAYHNAGYQVTLLVTLPEDAGTVPSYTAVKNWFDTELSTHPELKTYVDRWEIINEPDLNKYWAGTISQYVDNALKGAWDSLHPAGEKVIGAGISDADTGTGYVNLLNSLYNEGYQDYVDYLNIHPYTSSVSASNARVTAFKNKFAASGKPLVSTEWNLHMPSGTDNRNAVDTWEMNWANALEDLHDFAEDNFETIYYYRYAYKSSSVAGPAGLMYEDVNPYTPHQPFYDMFKDWTTSTPPASGIEDTYVKGDDTSPNGSEGILQVKNALSVDNDRESYLRFNLSTSGGTVSSAKVRLYGQLNMVGSVAVDVFDTAASPAWSEGSTVWSNRPASTGIKLGTITVDSTTAGWYELDLTSFIQAKKTAGATSVSFVLRADQGVTTDPYAEFQSSESATTGNRPQLVVVSGSTLTPSEDTYVKGDDATPNGSEGILQVKNATSTANDRESFIRFDVSSVTGTPASAKLRLYGGLNAVGSVAVDIFDTAASPTWNEASTVWSDRPSSTGTKLGTITVDSITAGWYELNITSFIQAKLAANASSVSFVLRADQSVTTDPYAAFNSSEAASDKPQLVLG